MAKHLGGSLERTGERQPPLASKLSRVLFL